MTITSRNYRDHFRQVIVDTKPFLVWYNYEASMHPDSLLTVEDQTNRISKTYQVRTEFPGIHDKKDKYKFFNTHKTEMEAYVVVFISEKEKESRI